MRNKRRKLKVQNAALLEDGQEKPQIFKNLRIYVRSRSSWLLNCELKH